MTPDVPNVIFLYQYDYSEGSFSRVNEISFLSEKLGFNFFHISIDPTFFNIDHIRKSLSGDYLAIWDLTNTTEEHAKTYEFIAEVAQGAINFIYNSRVDNVYLPHENAEVDSYKNVKAFKKLITRYLHSYIKYLGQEREHDRLPELGNALDVSIEIPEDMSEEEVLKLVSELSQAIDDEHRNAGGDGVKLADSELITITEKVPEPYV